MSSACSGSVCSLISLTVIDSYHSMINTFVLHLIIPSKTQYFLLSEHHNTNTASTAAPASASQLYHVARDHSRCRPSSPSADENGTATWLPLSAVAPVQQAPSSVSVVAPVFATRHGVRLSARGQPPRAEPTLACYRLCA